MSARSGGPMKGTGLSDGKEEHRVQRAGSHLMMSSWSRWPQGLSSSFDLQVVSWGSSTKM